MNLHLDSELRQLLGLVQELASGTPVYLVGGAIRDLLLGRPAKDLDFVQPNGSIQLARAVSRRLNGAVYTLDDVRHSARVILRQGEKDEQVLDFTSFIGESLDEDLRQRDFTINAMALALNATEILIDPLGGEGDLEVGRLRLCGPDSLISDPIRVLRGVRLISSYELKYELEIIETMRVAIKKIGAVSGERIRDELFKCLAVADFEVVAALLNEFKVFDELLLLTFGVDPEGDKYLEDEPERLASYASSNQNSVINQQTLPGKFNPELTQLHAYQTFLDAPLQGGRKRRHLLLLCSILLHIHPSFDVGKTGAVGFQPEMFARQISRALLTGQKETAYFEAVSGGFLRLCEFSTREPGKLDYYRFFRDFGAYGLDSALLAMVETETRAPLLAFNSEICQKIFQTWFTEQETTINPPRLVDGNLLQRELGIAPGSQIGLLLETIREQQVLDNIHTTGEAISFAKNQMRR